MRTIKFRGRDCNDNWHYGSLIQYKSGDVAIANFERYGYECTTMYRINVDPETIGQFTGMTDKNGKEIYEGDIVKYNKEVTQVKCDIRTARYILFDGRISYSLIDDENYEVIGNIHDNPELLKGGEE